MKKYVNNSIKTTVKILNVNIRYKSIYSFTIIYCIMCGYKYKAGVINLHAIYNIFI